MTSDIRTLMEAASKLPVEARAALADWLMQSLDESIDDDAARAWELEIAQRVRDIETGVVRPVPWSQARRAIAE